MARVRARRRGRGFGSSLSSLFSALSPIAKSIGKFGKRALRKTGKAMVRGQVPTPAEMFRPARYQNGEAEFIDEGGRRRRRRRKHKKKR
jgi:hypothetical protein